jgi:hypothetical protein
MGRYDNWVVDGDGHVAEPDAMWATLTRRHA